VSAVELLASLRESGVQISLVGDDLRLGGAASDLTDDLIKQVRSRKSALRAELRAESVEPNDPFLAWRLRNGEYLSDSDRARHFDALTMCVVHHRFLSYDEQRRGACSWCVPVEPEKERDYWRSRHGKLKAIGDLMP